jgi:septal ring factor EnvC (AmiA/AmiB activator)
MKMSRNFIIPLLSLIILLFFFDLYAQTQPQPQLQSQPQIQRKTILDFKDELKLSEAQVKSIKTIIDELERRNRTLMDKFLTLDKELKELLEKEGDLGEIRKRIREIYSLRADMVFNEIEAGRKIDKVLNKEQKEKWKQIRRGTIKKEGG